MVDDFQYLPLVFIFNNLKMVIGTGKYLFHRKSTIGSDFMGYFAEEK
jgi:hypothetical protein